MSEYTEAAHKSPSQHDVNYLLGIELKQEDADKVANCFYLYVKEIEALTKKLQLIASMCGNPDPAEACRLIIKVASL